MERSFTTTKGCARNTPSWVGRTAWRGNGLYVAVYSYLVFHEKMTVIELTVPGIWRFYTSPR